jgi:Uma2 family endonuclease
MPQPDCFLRIRSVFGEETHPDRKGYLFRAPELIAEVFTTTASYDLHEKMDLYRTERVKKYSVWRTKDSEIDWFIQKRRRFVRLPVDAAGTTRSKTFPGLWQDVPALLDDDLAKVLQMLRLGLNSPEHSAFAAKLKAKRRK